MPLLYGVVFVDLPDAVLPLLNLYKQLYKNRRWLCAFLLGQGGSGCRELLRLWAFSRALLHPHLHSPSRDVPSSGSRSTDSLRTLNPQHCQGWVRKETEAECPSPIFIKLEWLMSSMEITPRACPSSLASSRDRLQELSTIKKLLLKNKAIERFAPFWKIPSRAWSSVLCEEELLSLFQASLTVHKNKSRCHYSTGPVLRSYTLSQAQPWLWNFAATWQIKGETLPF